MQEKKIDIENLIIVALKVKRNEKLKVAFFVTNRLQEENFS